jgi:acetyltransferase-like isoleucine patch superfamily enzyme
MALLGRALRKLLAPTVNELIQEALLHQPLVYGDRNRLHVDPTAVINNALFNLSSGEVWIGKHAFFGHNVCLFTGTHEFTAFGAERQVAVPKSGRDIVVGEGAWISSNATVVGPCRIGEHSVVGVCALVLEDVPAYTVVAGVPAKARRSIPSPDEVAERATRSDGGAT